MADEKDSRPTPENESTNATLSRREILTAGLAVASAGLTPVHAAAAQGPSARSVIGVAPAGSTAVEFRARLAQSGASGERFIAYGYVTRAYGATTADLFAGPTEDATTALVTAYASGDLVRRTIDQSVHSLDIQGSITIYERSGPGATFSDPDSFQQGTPVARFSLKLQDILSVFAPAKGIPTLTGDMRQTLADRLSGSGAGPMFGHVAAEARLFATGLGTLVDPVTLNANLEMAGNWTTK